MTEPLQIERILAAIGIVLGALVIGFALRVLLGRVRTRAANTRWSGDDLIVTVLRDLAVPLPLAAGLWSAVLILDLRAGLRGAAGRVLMSAIIVVASLVAARFAGGIVGSAARSRDGVARSASIFVHIARIVVFGIGMLILLQSLGVSITPLLGALGVGGLAVALALQDTLANLFAGVHILASKKVQTGDFVRLDVGQEGHIIDINWRNTTIQQLGGNLVVVPNSRFADAVLTNYSRPQQDMSVSVQVGVGYDSDLEEVERVTLDVARAVMKDVAGGVGDHEPLVRFHTFGDSSVDFSVILRSDRFADQYVLVHEFIKRLHRRYRDEGIEIPFPVRMLVTAGAENGAAPAEPVRVSAGR